MGTFWENLDKIGIVLGILVFIIDSWQWVKLRHIEESQDEQDEDIEDIMEELDIDDDEAR